MAVDLETRTIVLETKVTYIEDKLADQVEKLEQVCEGVTLVREHIAKQNGALPRIEANTALAASRINQLEDILFTHANADKDEAIKNAKEIATFSVKQKIGWSIAIFLVGGALAEIINLSVRFFF